MDQNAAKDAQEQPGGQEPAAAVGQDAPVMREIGLSRSKRTQDVIGKLNNKFALAGAAVAVIAVFYALAGSVVEPKAPSPAPLLAAKPAPSEPILQPAQASAPVAADASSAASQALASASAAGAASAASVPSHAASGVAQEGVAAAAAAAHDHVALIAARLEALEEELGAAKKRISELEAAVKSAPRAQSGAQPVAQKKQAASAPKAQADYVAVSILEIGSEGVLVSEGSDKIMVRPGGRLPGGSTFLGFDAQASVMRTDQGDYRIDQH